MADSAAIKRAWKEMAADAPLFADRMLSKSPLSPKVHEGQVRWLREANAPINILIPGNRFGKSVVSAMRHIHHCMFKVGWRPAENDKHTYMTAPYETISVSVSADQAEIVFNEAKRLIAHPAIKPFVKRVYATPFPRIVFFNGAVMHCRSAHDDGKYIDGHAYRLVTIDEAGWLKNDLKKLMNGVIIMRLAGGGMIDLVGTPKGMGDLYWYANRGLRGADGYYTQRGSIYDNPYLSPDDLKVRDELLKHADARMREQVLYGAFVSDAGMAFTQDQLEQVFDASLPVHADYVPGRRYVQAWDLARQTDFTVGVTFDVTRPPYPMVDYQRLNKVPWESIYALIAAKSAEYHVDQPIIDASGPGGDVIEEELTKRGLFVDAFKMNSGARKLNLVNTLQSALDWERKQVGETMTVDEAGLLHPAPVMEPVGGEWGLLRMPAVPQLLDEFGTYELADKKLVTDSVMAVGMAISSVYDGSVLDRPLPGIWSVRSEVAGACAVCGVRPVTDSLVSGRNPESGAVEERCLAHVPEEWVAIL
jgi:hypothetical protein